MFLSKFSSKAGFTLIELMVVIGIISVLAVAGLAAISTVQKSARENKRVTDIVNIVAMAESYRDQTGAFPMTSYAAFTTAIPKAPVAQNAAYLYVYTADATGTQFCVCARLETLPKGNAAVTAAAGGVCTLSTPTLVTASFYCAGGGI